MKLHPTLVEKLIKTYEIYSGWQEESKLRTALAKLNIAVYTQQNGTDVLVDAEELQKQLRTIKAESK